MLNNRELASAILLAIGLIAACFSGCLRSKLLSLARAVFGWKLSILWIIYVGLVAATTYGLHRVGLGYPDSTKDAVVWGLIAGLPILFKFGDAGNGPRFARDTIGGVVRVTAFVEFFVNLYVFPLLVELFFQVFIAVIVVGGIVAATDQKMLPVKKLLDGLAAATGFVVVFLVGRHLIQHRGKVDGRSTVLSFLQPVILSVVVVAMTYIVALVSSYELAFMRIGWGQPSRRQRVRAKLALLVTLHVRLQKVHHFFGFLPGQLADADSWRAARRIVRDYKSGVPPVD